MGVIILSALIIGVLLVIPSWRIFRRAGLDPWISLVVLVPGIGMTIALAVLAFVDWPAASGNGEADPGDGPAGAI